MIELKVSPFKVKDERIEHLLSELVMEYCCYICISPRLD